MKTDMSNLQNDHPPRVVILAGPNGAGKSTSAKRLLRGALGVDEFVNADVIAQGLSGFTPERVAMAAGRVMLRRLNELAASRVNFAFETTLASRTFVPWLMELKQQGYRIHLVFLWLSSADNAVERVADRVRQGGHDVLEETVRRRYQRGLSNFLRLYRPVVNSWQLVDNSSMSSAQLIAAGQENRVDEIRFPGIWERICIDSGVKP